MENVDWMWNDVVFIIHNSIDYKNKAECPNNLYIGMHWFLALLLQTAGWCYVWGLGMGLSVIKHLKELISL